MKVTAVLCNHAEAVNNLLYISGAGINRSFVPPNAQPPYRSNLAIGILLTVPWTQTNQQHTVQIDLVDQDSRPVLAPDEAGGDPVMHAEVGVNVGRPPDLPIGDDQSVALALSLAGLTVAALDRYRFIIKVDGVDLAELPWTLMAVPGSNMSGLGPTALR